MKTDFRVAVDFFTHHKARKLKKRLGAAAVLSLLQLWAYAAKLRTDGSLSGMTPEDIELAAEWEGEDGAFAAALEEIGFIDVQRPSDGRQTNADGRSTFSDASEIRLHDWADHNQWAADYDDRSDKARFSRLATVNRKAFEKLKAQGVNAISKNDYDMLTKAQRPSDGRQTNADAAPTPAPSPSPEEIQGGGVNARARVAESVPENPTHGPKKTDCPSKGNPQWAAFLSCWQVYPVKQGQEEAWREWMRLHGNGTLAEPFAIRDAILALAQEDSRWQRGKIRNMARWLNGKGWEDKPFREPSPPAAPDAITRARAPTEHQRRQQENRNMAVALLAAREQERQQNAENHGGNVHAGQAEIGGQAR